MRFVQLAKNDCWMNIQETETSDVYEFNALDFILKTSEFENLNWK